MTIVKKICLLEKKSAGKNIKKANTILATGCLDVHCKIKESLLIKDLKPTLNENVGSERLFLY